MNNSNSQFEMMRAFCHRLKPMAESQNLLKQVGERPHERVLTRFWGSLGIHSQAKVAK